MDKLVKDITDQVISICESLEDIIQKDLIEYKKKYEKNEFMPGWTTGISIMWQQWEESESIGIPGVNTLTAHCNFNGIHVSDTNIEESPEIDLSQLTEELIKGEINDILSNWAQKKVDSSPYGGVYDSSFSIHTVFDVYGGYDSLEEGQVPERLWITIYPKGVNEDKKNQLNQKIFDFIKNGEYKEKNIKDLDESLADICHTAAKDYFDQLGKEVLETFYESLLSQALKTNEEERMGHIVLNRLMRAFNFAGKSLLESAEELANGDEGKDARLELCCTLAKYLIMESDDEYQQDDGRELLKESGSMGSKTAKRMLKFGTGNLPEKLLSYKDDKVVCKANDIEKVIDLKIKEESEESYEKMLNFIINLIDGGFPREYSIKFNSKEKNYLPIKDLKKTKANIFWNNCTEYSGLYDQVKKYIRLIMNEFDFYSDAEEDEAVPVGGYAMFGLGLKDISNGDIVYDFMKQNDSEHSVTPTDFVAEYIDRFGVTPENARVVAACLYGSNSSGYHGENFDGLKDADTLKAFVDALHELMPDKLFTQLIVIPIWGGKEELEEAIENAGADTKPLLEDILSGY